MSDLYLNSPRKNKGKTFITIILFIVIIFLICFVFYEINQIKAENKEYKNQNQTYEKEVKDLNEKITKLENDKKDIDFKDLSQVYAGTYMYGSLDENVPEKINNTYIELILNEDGTAKYYEKTNGTDYTLNGYYTIGSNLIYFVSDTNIVQFKITNKVLSVVTKANENVNLNKVEKDSLKVLKSDK